MTIFQAAILLSAAFFAGVLNAIAGGGSFLTLPALALVGVPLVSANATGTAALLPGYISSTLAFRSDLRPPAALSMRELIAWSVAGGAFGAGLLLVTSNDAFRQLVPWLLLAATAMFAFGGRLISLQNKISSGTASPGAAWRARLTIFAVTTYGGYFNGGVGILLLAAFAMLGERNLHAMNGAKNFVSAILTLIAVALYAASGVIVWHYALMMMVASALGGYAGVRIARLLPIAVVRGVVIVTGSVMTLLFFLRR
jgi:uncharacterized membrane protein YfcA